MESIKKEIALGALVSLATTCVGFFLYIAFFSEDPLEETIRNIGEMGLYGKVLTLAAVPNLLVFFLFIQKKQDYRARGVLMATFFVAFLTLVLRFL